MGEVTPTNSRKRGRGVRALIPDVADGTHPGNAPGINRLVPFNGHALVANLERAATLLRQLERVLTRAGGYMSPEDQDALRAARALLVDLGK